MKFLKIVCFTFTGTLLGMIVGRILGVEDFERGVISMAFTSMGYIVAVSEDSL